MKTNVIDKGRCEMKKSILAPLLISLFPVTTMIAGNLGQIEFQDVIRPIAFSLILGLVSWLIIYVSFRERNLTAVISTFVLIMFFSYGHVYDYLKEIIDPSLVLVRHRYLAPIWVLATISGIYMIVWLGHRIKISLSTTIGFLLLMLVIPLTQIGYSLARQFVIEKSQVARLKSHDNHFTNSGITSENLPDIYYIVLDEYARADTLQEIYDLDNRNFLSELEEIGFYVAECSQSNYPRTRQSLTSALNMVYLDDLGYSFNQKTKDLGWLNTYLEFSEVRRLLESRSYRFIAFETGYPWTSFESADILFEMDKPSEYQNLHVLGLSRFEILFLNSTFIRTLLDATRVFPGLVSLPIIEPDQIDRLRVLYSLDKLDELPGLPGPKFIFAHIISPHGPYVFGPNGEIPQGSQSPIAGYANQVLYLNSRLIQILQSLIEQSDVPPIIILQGDHGARNFSKEDTEEKIKHSDRILNAFYLQGVEYDELYRSISTVNTFRVILNYVLSANYHLLPDVSYWSPLTTPFDFTIVPNECQFRVGDYSK